MKQGLLSFAVSCLFTALPLGALGAVSFSSQPTALSVNAGSTAAFSVSVKNASAISCQWQLNGTNLLGETNLILTMENVSANQAGSYRAVVTADGQAGTSSAAKLTVLQGTIVIFKTAYGEIKVELFDHDKPMTVQNFLHYYNEHHYTNTFFHRLLPGIVLQGGAYETTNHSDTPLTITNIVDLFEKAQYTGGIDGTVFATMANEFNTGPLVRNTYGTLAMATNFGESWFDSSYTNVIASQWEFNLADNSSNAAQKGLTVFGRIISGTNVLEKFNQLSTNNGIIDLGNYWPHGATNASTYWVYTNTAFGNVPVQSGADYPKNTQLFFVNVAVQGKTTIDKTGPKLWLSSPANNSRTTNNYLVLSGGASDDTGVAYVGCTAYYLWYTNWQSIYTQFRYDANGTTNWTLNITNILTGDFAKLGYLPPGTYVVYLSARDGYGNQTRGYVTYYVTTPLSVKVVGPGSVSPNLNGQWVNNYENKTMTAVPKSGQFFVNWTGEGFGPITTAKLTFTMTEGQVITALFASNYFPNITATYSGLFMPTNQDRVAATNAGAVKLTLAGTGKYSGQLLLAGQTLSFSGAFDYKGDSKTAIKPSEAAAKALGSTNSLTLALAVDLTNGTGLISGTVSNGIWASPLTAFLGVKQTAAKYMVALPAGTNGTSQPEGSGYAVASVSAAGAVSLAGKMADGAAISSGIATVAKGGQWPFYASLNNGQGVVLGWENITNASAPVLWSRTASAGGAYGAFSTVLEATGGLYSKPASNATYQVTLDNGPLNDTISGSVVITTAGACATSGIQGGALKLSLATGTGLVTGTLTPTGSTAMTVSGVFQNSTNGAWGFFTNKAGLSGSLRIK